MKKAATFIIIGALVLSLGSSLVRASEVSGTISTDGSHETNNPTPSPTPTPNDTDTGHSSEVGGNLGTGSGSNNGVTTGGGGSFVSAEVATTTATSTSGISDEEMARLALMSFGPRFGTPGAPLAGGSSGSQGSNDLSVRNDSVTDVSLEEIVETQNPFVAYIPRTAEAPVSDTNLVANALTSTSGLSMPQLVLIALLGLILLGSMGYAISQTTGVKRRPLA